MGSRADETNGNTEAWYKDGLRFRCTGCGNCCTGEPGYVWVNNQEVQSISSFLGIDLGEFERRYVRKVGVRKSLVELSNGDCVFLDENTRKCQVYDVRPRQCRTWPFWRSNLRTPQDWEETCQVCPGSGKGKLYSLQEIEQQASVLRL